MPLTWLGVQERVQHIASRDDRAEELDKCYGIDFKGLQEHQKEAGVSSRNLPIGTFSDSYKRRHCKHFRLAPPGHDWSDKGPEYEKMARRAARVSAVAPPAMAAVIVPEPSGLSSIGSTGQSASSSLSAPAETTARVVPRGTVAAMPRANPPLEGLSRESRAYRLSLMQNMTDSSNQKIYNLNKCAKAKRATMMALSSYLTQIVGTGASPTGLRRNETVAPSGSSIRMAIRAGLMAN